MKKTMIAAICLLFSAFIHSCVFAAVEKGTYDTSLLINWTDETFLEAYGVTAGEFVPSDPQPLTYIVTCEPVINPLTGGETEEGWDYYHRTLPASTRQVMWKAADLSDFSLSLTDDPDRASFRAIISYTYLPDGYFNYTSENTQIPKYKGVLAVTLVNMITGENVSADREWWAFPESSIEVSVLDEGIGRQFFAGPISLDSSDISAFMELLGMDIDALYDYVDENEGVCITRYLGENVETLELPSIIHGKPVTGIGEYALEGNYFSSVILPETLTHIDKGAFSICNYLTSITIPESVIAIGDETFNNDSALEQINLPEGLTQIGSGAFSYCEALKNITLPRELKEISPYLFSGTGIASIEIPETVTKIGKSAFSSCKNLQSVFLPENVSVIGEYAFSNCISLNDVICQGEIRMVDHAAFIDCDQLVSVWFRKGVGSVGDSAFSRCHQLKTMDLWGVKSIGSDVFREDAALTSVLLPETLTEIGKHPFGEHQMNVSFSIPPDLVLTIVEGSYAMQWVKEENIPYVFAEPPSEEELMARQYPPLEQGSRGEQVRILQQKLIDKGFLNDTADGSYGPKTAAAVSVAQEAFNMEPDGVASALFQTRLYGDD